MSKDNPEKHSPIEPETNQLFCGRCGKPAIRGKNIGDHCGQFFDIEKNGMFCSGTIVEPDTPLQPVKDEGYKIALEKIRDLKEFGFQSTVVKEMKEIAKEALSSPPEPSSKDDWQTLTQAVCGRDMSGLNYYKDDLLKGVESIKESHFNAGLMAERIIQSDAASKEQEWNQDELWKEVVEIADGYIVDFAVSSFETDYGIGGGVIDELKQKFKLYKKKP